MSDTSRILVIDDEKNYLMVMQALLMDAGYEVTALNDPEMALHFLEESEVDVVITDMKMPKLSGKEVLQSVKKSWPNLPVLIMTAFGSIESAVEAMRYGAFDYITKPFANDEMLLSVHNAVELSKAHRQYKLLQESLEERYSTHQIIGRSKAIRDTLSIVDRVALSRSTVLITGESGTGKELVARAIHFTSPRKEGPFVSVNCMAFNSGVLDGCKENTGFKTSLSLIKNSAKVSNVCADVIGDVAGVLSGSISVLIATKMTSSMGLSFDVQFIISAIVASLTIGGKAIGKGLAQNNSTKIVGFVGKVLRIFKREK